MILFDQNLILPLLLFIFLASLELIFPLRKRKLSYLPHFINNIIISFTALLFGSSVVSLASGYFLNNPDYQGTGLLRLIPLPYWLYFTLSFLLMDLSFYYWHRLNHQWNFLWRFHIVHHIDPDLDISTGFRFHFMELIFSSVFRSLQIFLIGINPGVYIFYEAIFRFSTLFHHSNIRINPKFEKIVNYIFVSPRIHGIHHSDIKEETNSNYSVIFIWWDYLHNSLKTDINQERINIGIPAYSNDDDNRVFKLLFLPFQKQKDYWKE